MSGQNLCQGFDLKTGLKVVQPHRRYTVARASGAIACASPVMIDANATTLGLNVVLCSSTADHAVMGMFEGASGAGASGAATTVTNIVGNLAAITNDAIEVLLEGPTFCRAKMSATNAGTLTTTQATVTLANLSCSAVDGIMQIQTLPAAGINAKVILTGAGTYTDGITTEGSAIACYLNP